jgi:hypothetical protein
VIDLSSSLDEEDFVADVAGDFEFAQQIFGKLNCDVLGPHGNGKVIILDDFEEEEEVCEEATSNIDVVPSAVARRPSTPAASPADANEDPGAAPNDSTDGLALGLKMGKDNDDRDEAGTP